MNVEIRNLFRRNNGVGRRVEMSSIATEELGRMIQTKDRERTDRKLTPAEEERLIRQKAIYAKRLSR